jgi:hypothetical protein
LDTHLIIHICIYLSASDSSGRIGRQGMSLQQGSFDVACPCCQANLRVAFMTSMVEFIDVAEVEDEEVVEKVAGEEVAGEEVAGEVEEEEVAAGVEEEEVAADVEEEEVAADVEEEKVAFEEAARRKRLPGSMLNPIGGRPPVVRKRSRVAQACL